MAKESANAERSSGSNNADTLASSANRPAPFVRYWHTVTEISSPPRSDQAKSDPNTVPGTNTSVFQTPISSNAITTIELLKEEPSHVVEIESSDEDEVVEVALPPKPTITIESSDDEAVAVTPVQVSTPLNKPPSVPAESKKRKKQKNKRRAESASPVPSVVSSISDDFIRGDCLAFNISKKPQVEQFDFNLHGADLLDQHSNSLSQKTKKKKAKNKSKDKDKTATPRAEQTPPKVSTPPPSTSASKQSETQEQTFTTPQNKAKRKTSKNYVVSELSIPDPDIYESDSNQSAQIETVAKPVQTEENVSKETTLEQILTTPQNKGKRKTSKNYAVSELSIPDPDIYESDSNQSTQIETVAKPAQAEENVTKETENTETVKISVETAPEPIKSTQPVSEPILPQTVDLTIQEAAVSKEPVPVEDNLVMGNVTGFESLQETPVSDKRSLGKRSQSSSKSVPNKIPRQTLIMNNEGVIETTYASVEHCREEMERYYNESWGGENFDHFDVQRNMPKDKSLWAIDPRDRMLSSASKKRCHYCNQLGHAYERCKLKPRICHMCGSEGHYEPRCPNRMCLKCGTPNSIYSIHCRNCANWNRMFCDVCQITGHPAKNCPDLWRRYHSTMDNDGFLIKQTTFKRRDQLFCSGCTRRGHLAHTCHQVPFSNLPIYSPFVSQYRPVYPPSFSHDFPSVSSSGRYFSMPDQEDTDKFSQQRPQNMYDNNSHNRQHYQNSPQNRERFENSPENRGNFENAPQNIRNFENNQQNKINYHNSPQSRGNFNQASAPNPNDLSQRIGLGNSSSVELPQRDNQKRPLISSKDEDSNKKRSVSNSEVISQDMKADQSREESVVSSTTDDHESVLQDNEVSNTSEVITTGKIYIQKNIMEDLKKEEGCEWLAVTSGQHNVQVNLVESPTTFIKISGLQADLESFQYVLKEWVSSRIRKLIMKDSPTEETLNTSEIAATDNDDFCKDIPQNKYKLLRMLNRALAFLQSDLGDPNAVYKELLYLQKNHNRLLMNKMISPKKLNNNRTKINEILKNLNMILVGQAGLADGSRHVRELYSLQDVLMKYKKHDLPYELRNKIGEHYHFVFNSVARNDYADLMNKFYGKSKFKQVKGRSNNKKKAIKKSPGKTLKKLLNRREENKNPGQENNVIQQNSENNAQCQAKDGNKNKEYTIDQIQSCQKKLRKDNTLNEQKQQWKHVLLSRLRKFQVQVKRRGLFQKQYIQLDKLLVEVKKFFGEA